MTYLLTDIEWYISPEELAEKISNLSVEKKLELFGTNILNLSEKQSAKYIKTKIHHIPALIYEICDIPEVVSLPKEVYNKVKETKDVSFITEYLEDTFGYFLLHYDLNKELCDLVYNKF